MKRRLVVICLMLSLLLMLAAPAGAVTPGEEVQLPVYTVLVLDATGSHNFYSGSTRIYTADTAINEVKKAATDFSRALLGLNGEHHVAVVAYTDKAVLVSDFSQDPDKLAQRIGNISQGAGKCALSLGINKADSLLSGITDPLALKNAVIFTTGFTNYGSYSGGKYNSTTPGSTWYSDLDGDHRQDGNEGNLYQYANTCLKNAEVLSEQADIYTVGLFENWGDMPEKGKELVSFFKMFTQDLAMERKVPVFENYNPAYSRADIENAFKKVCNCIINNDFADVTYNNFYFYPVIWAIEEEITQGTTPTTFRPLVTCTREQMVTLLWRAAGKPTPVSTETPFEDITRGSYSYDAILWAEENGITEGTGESTFSPRNIVTREQVVTFLWRYAGQPEPEGAMPFTDVQPGWSYTAISWASETGITQGITETLFYPQNHCTRGQIVTFLYRYFVENLWQNGEIPAE